jgi:hypothetical protein
MKPRIRLTRIALVFLALALLPRPALAAFHLMEIEQVIGGVGGDTSAQAIQLKMRTTGQNLLSGAARVRVFDANGLNPIPLITFASNPASGACREILLATPGMAAKTSPALTPDYTMAAIPASYLAAGSLTFETTGGGVYWRVSWGGATYTGADTVIAGTGGVANDSDGHVAPPFAGPLPSTTAQALKFSPDCSLTTPGLSTTSAADYAPTSGAATLVNNASTAFTVLAPPPIPGLPGASRWLVPGALGVSVVAFAFLRRRRSA